jgi:LPXTG-motif cell wall-anchored protein
VRATETATPVPTGELPDTGFGGFLQPLAGFALVGVAFAARALRNRS